MQRDDAGAFATGDTVRAIAVGFELATGPLASVTSTDFVYTDCAPATQVSTSTAADPDAWPGPLWESNKDGIETTAGAVPRNPLAAQKKAGLRRIKWHELGIRTRRSSPRAGRHCVSCNHCSVTRRSR